MPESTTLTTAQRRWCEHVNAGMNRSAATRLVWPNVKAVWQKAYAVGKLPHVQAELDRLASRSAADAGVTALAVLNDLVTIKNRCMQAEQVLDKDGNPTGEYAFREQGAIKALELLGKHLRMWSEESDASRPTIGPGLTVIVQQATQVKGERTVQTHHVQVNLPGPPA